MSSTLKTVSILFVLIIFLSGCATKTASKLEHIDDTLSALDSSMIVIVRPEDDRKPNPDVDVMWAKDPLDDLEKILHDEIKSTGLFKEIVSLKKSDKEKIAKSNARTVMYSSLKELEWEVPDRKKQSERMFIMRTLTGGAGGYLYGSAKIDFYGKTKIKITLVDQGTGESLIEKEYSYRAEEKILPLKTELSKERTRIIGKALKEVMIQLKTDLERLSKDGRL